MAGEFNPYHVWLGISPEEQPANYYRLLGLRLFEDNRDVIDNAADRQMAHLRTFQSGAQGVLTQQLLNEVAAARVCLLDAKTRAAYDQELRAEMPPPVQVVAASKIRGAGKSTLALGIVAATIAAAVVAAVIGIGLVALNRSTPASAPTAAVNPAKSSNSLTASNSDAASNSAKLSSPAKALNPAAVSSPATVVNPPTIVNPAAALNPGAAAAQPANPEPSVEIVSARWGGGENWADVTQAVKEAVAKHKPVWATSDFLETDPTPGWRKHLQMTIKTNGRIQSLWLEEGQHWRIDQSERDQKHEKFASGRHRSGRPTSTTEENPQSPAETAANDADTFPKTIVELGEAAAQVRTGGGGRFLIFHLKQAGKLAIVDVTKSAVVATIDVPDDVRYAAGMDKLLVVRPAQKLIQRYSLTDFQREKTAPLPDDAPMFVAVMGCNSTGPLVLRGQQGRDYSTGGLLFWDVEKMAVAPFPRDLVGGGPIRISADGKTLIGWTSGLSGQKFQLARFTPRGIEEFVSPDGHDYGGWWVTPTADGSYVLSYNGEIYSHNLKLVPSDAFSGSVLLPCEDPRLMLAARMVDRRHGRRSSELSIATLNDQQILYTLSTPELTSKEIRSTDEGYFEGEPRAHYVPNFNTVVTFPEGNDQVVIRQFDLAQALNQRKADYLFVVSKPPAEVKFGETFTYRLQVLTNAASVKYKLESGPEGMTIADDGQISWPVTQAAIEHGARVIISVSAENGKTAFHSFGLSLAGSLPTLNPAGSSNRFARHSFAAPRRSPSTGSNSKTQAEDFQPSIVQLGEPATQMRIGGKGRYLIFHLKQAGKLTIVDVEKSAVVNSIDVPEDVRYAASFEKLLVVLPTQKLVQRYSLKTFELEKTAALPDDAPTDVVVMGCNSDGPLALRGAQGPLYTAGKLMFWDIDKMAVSDLPQNVVGGDAIRISADGRTLIGWTTGISNQQFELARMTHGNVETFKSPDGQDYNGWWATPTADGSYVLRFNAGIYSADLKPLPSAQFEHEVLMPCEDPRFMLALRLADAPLSSQVRIVTLTDRQTLDTLRTPEFRSDPTGSAKRGYFDQEPRVQYLPELNALVTVPDSNDVVTIRHFDLADAMRRQRKYLFVVSKPPAQAKVGETFSYQPHLLTDAKSTRYRLIVAPPGVHLASNGLITWQIKQQPIGGTAKFVMLIEGDNGKNAIHSFELFVSRDRPEFAAHQPPRGTPPATVPNEPAVGPETQELVVAGEFRLAGSKGPLAVVPGRDGKSLLVLQQDRLAILGADGITIQKEVTLPKSYMLLGEREKYYVAIAADPQSIDLIDKTSLRVLKSLKLPGGGTTDLTLHPTEALCYVAYRAGADIPRFRFLVYDENSGEAHELDHCVGKWLQISPDGSFLIAGYSDIYQRGQQLVVNPDNIFFVPEYGSIDWLIRYDLKNPEKPVAVEKQTKAGGNGVGLRMSVDGQRVTYLSHVGYPMYSNNLGGWDPTDLHKLPVSYRTKDVGAPQELAYHPRLPMAASFGKSTVVVFDRETGDLLPDRVKLLDNEQVDGNIQRVYFTPDGRHLLIDTIVNQIHYLVQAELKLTAAELKQLESPPPAPPKTVKKPRTA